MKPDAPLVPSDPLCLELSTRRLYEKHRWWWACDYPERLPDLDVVFHLPATGCRACAIAAEALAHREPGSPLYQADLSDADRTVISVEEVVEQWKERIDD